MSVVPITNALSIINNSIVTIFKFNSVPTGVAPIFTIADRMNLVYSPSSQKFIIDGVLYFYPIYSRLYDSVSSSTTSISTSYTYAYSMTFTTGGQLVSKLHENKNTGSGFVEILSASQWVSDPGANLTTLYTNAYNIFKMGWSTGWQNRLSPSAIDMTVIKVAYYIVPGGAKVFPKASELTTLATQVGVNTIGASGYLFDAPNYFSPCVVQTAGGSPVYASDGVTLSGNSAQISIVEYNAVAPLPLACFTAGSQILTPSGYQKVEDLKDGDSVSTADGRVVPATLYTQTVIANKNTAPYLIPKNALGFGVPAADLRLSPWHAIQLKKGLWMKPASAAELNPGSVTQYGLGETIAYYHVETPNYFTDNLVCDGTVVESFAGEQLRNIQGRVYTFNRTHRAYTRMSPATQKALTQ